MPVFRNFSADGKLLEEFAEPLSEKNFNRFVAEYGEEKAKMYLEILGELTREISYVLFPYLKEESNCFVRGGLHTVQKNLNILFEHNKSILELGEKILASGNVKPNDSKAGSNVPG